MELDTFIRQAFRAVCATGLTVVLAACATSASQEQAPAIPQFSEYAPSEQQTPAQNPVPQYAERQVAVNGTAFPVDGSAGEVPPGSRLVVRVYDAAGGDVNIHVAERAFRLADGLPVRFRVSAPEQKVQGMDLPAVAARVEGPRGRVIYRNEVAVLLKLGRAGDIPMTRQKIHSAGTRISRKWKTPRETE